jgi:uncharacterized protein YbjT (DUF2867 family)
MAMILVTGATGMNGRALMPRLSKLGVPVRALVRDRAKAAALADLPGVEIVDGDMGRPETLTAALAGVDRVMLISSSDPAMLDVQSNVVTATRAAGVRHMVKLSGIMPERDSPFRFARMHGEIERRVEDSGMDFTHLRAGEFMTAYFRQVPNIVRDGVVRLPMGEARIASIDIEDVAEVAARVLTSDGHEGRIYAITGPEALTMHQVAERLSTAIGRPVRYVDVPPEAMTRAQLAAGMPPYMAEALAELFAERRRGKESNVHPTVQALLGRPPTSFQQFAIRNADVFRGERPSPKV